MQLLLLFSPCPLCIMSLYHRKDIDFSASQQQGLSYDIKKPFSCCSSLSLSLINDPLSVRCRMRIEQIHRIISSPCYIKLFLCKEFLRRSSVLEPSAHSTEHRLLEFRNLCFFILTQTIPLLQVKNGCPHRTAIKIVTVHSLSSNGIV